MDNIRIGCTTAFGVMRRAMHSLRGEAVGSVSPKQDQGEAFMAHRPQRIEFDDFASNLDEVFEQVRDRNEPVLVERDGETYRLEKDPAGDIWKDYDAERVKKAIAKSAGLLRGVDVHALIEELDVQREQSEGRFE